MKITKLIEGYKSGTITNLRDAIEFKDYVPFYEKYELCSSVLDVCNDINETTGLVAVDSLSRHTTFVMKMLDMYTNIDFSFEDNSKMSDIDGYDILCKSSLLKPILALIGDEYEACEHMLMTMQEDLIANNNTLHNAVGHVATKALNIIEGLAGQLKQKIDSFDVSQMDWNKYKYFLEKIGIKE